MIEVLTNSIVTGLMYALVAVSFTCIYSVSRTFHFAHAAVYTYAAYLYYLIVVSMNMKWWLAAPISIAGACLIGISIERIVYRPLRQQGASNLMILLASIGALVVLQNIIPLLFGDNSKNIRSPQLSENLHVLFFVLTPIRLMIITICITVILFTWILLKKTKLGKQAKAVANNPALAEIFGIEQNKIILQITALGSGVAAVAAILQSYDTNITPLMGFNILLMGVTATIIGGIDSLIGATLGGLLVGFAQHIGIYLMPSQWQDTIVFALLILFLIFRPNGFLGRPLQRVSV